jgi:hypothetical protein
MSTYEYYEFQALDRSLTDQEQASLRGYSGRARITATRFVKARRRRRAGAAAAAPRVAAAPRRGRHARRLTNLGKRSAPPHHRGGRAVAKQGR